VNFLVVSFARPAIIGSVHDELPSDSTTYFTLSCCAGRQRKTPTSLGSVKNNFPFDHLAIIMTEDVRYKELYSQRANLKKRETISAFP